MHRKEGESCSSGLGFVLSHDGSGIVKERERIQSQIHHKDRNGDSRRYQEEMESRGLWSFLQLGGFGRRI